MGTASIELSAVGLEEAPGEPADIADLVTAEPAVETRKGGHSSRQGSDGTVPILEQADLSVPHEQPAGSALSVQVRRDATPVAFQFDMLSDSCAPVHQSGHAPRSSA
jgi:hypothetical protein